MNFQFSREALKAALYANRKRMSKAQRKASKKKRVTNIYPWAVERRYAASIKAWLKPMMDFVSQYLKNNQEAILRGDTAALTRNDAVPGGSFRRMVSSLNGWMATYIPNRNETVDTNRRGPPVVYLGLNGIAESLADFTSNQWRKAAVENIGVEFAVYENWWPDTKKAWADKNYDLIKSLSENYISQVNQKTELAVMNGWSPRQLVKEIMKVNDNMKKSKANLIARDQIGKLNGQTTQARMEAVGLDLYEWSTCGDERVRGDPSGKYPNGRPSHYELDGKICRWDDPTVYSEDGGKTWKDRPSSWCQLHPGYDIQCRCTALSYWAELIEEVDKELALQEGYDIQEMEDEEPEKIESKEVVLSHEYSKAFSSDSKQLNTIVNNTYENLTEENRKLLEKVLGDENILKILPENSEEPNSWLNGLIQLKESVIKTFEKGGENPFMHELGHMLDEKLSQIMGKIHISNGYKKKWEELGDVLVQDWFKLIEKFGNVDLVRSHVFNLSESDPYKWDAITDLIGGLSGKPLTNRFGHPSDYWENVFIRPRDRECFAHLFVASNDKEKRKLFETFFPSTLKWYNKVQKILLKEAGL